ncbi:MAG TPA: energy transducer TonB [Bacteroidales bacterium]|jgi:protein TonB|nr:TonB family protein [Bacteroidales bacterium]OQB65550.1 MAG: Gram-negative bacterial tonB protein [Bacteroidetes bacterium ADurb.Bin145]NMD02848.1 energy transducer TonB [Bacteroidales bacterium]HOU01090.1 energy transducer TonB [Bacteroidales bacterium]HQG62492.1 energy transducer TonB [Bacteroidales bacterium]
MAKEKLRAPAFDDIVFELRNKEYGAYKLRKRYSRNMLIALFIGLVILCSAVIGPFINAKAAERSRTMRKETQVEIQLENLDQPTEQVAPPPPPPPPPTEAVTQARYAPPVVVDTLKPEEVVQLMTADQAIETVVDADVTAIQIIEEVKEEVAEEEPEPEPFVVVEEMPMFPGGDAELLAYISAHTQYPEAAKENNIQGRVIVRFCVTSKGTVSQVSVLKGVDPDLDAEAVRVVTTLPAFKPGKQGGKPVPVWYMVPITFTLK